MKKPFALVFRSGTKITALFWALLYLGACSEDPEPPSPNPRMLEQNPYQGQPGSLLLDITRADSALKGQNLYLLTRSNRSEAPTFRVHAQTQYRDSLRLRISPPAHNFDLYLLVTPQTLSEQPDSLPPQAHFLRKRYLKGNRFAFELHYLQEGNPNLGTEDAGGVVNKLGARALVADSLRGQMTIRRCTVVVEGYDAFFNKGLDQQRNLDGFFDVFKGNWPDPLVGFNAYNNCMRDNFFFFEDSSRFRMQDKQLSCPANFPGNQTGEWFLSSDRRVIFFGDTGQPKSRWTAAALTNLDKSSLFYQNHRISWIPFGGQTFRLSQKTLWKLTLGVI